jgi:nephrocystin-3
MPSSDSNELRVFISSTFKDLQEEREHLIKKVFPEIRAISRERGVTFTEVDLRWGITEENVTSGRVIRTCLEEIERTRPYFIGITGKRYGFIPKPEEIIFDRELVDRFPWIPAAIEEGASLTDLEFRYGALHAGISEAGSARAVFYFRDREAEHDIAPEDIEHLAHLEQRVRDQGFRVHEYHDPKSLGEQVRQELLEILNRDFGESAPPTPLEAERVKHEAFAASRRRAYLPNQAYTERLDTFAASEEAPLVIYASSGAGKSSLVAHWANDYRKRHPETAVIEHYIGVGAGATDHYTVMRHIMEEIKARYDRAEEIPTKPEELERQFANWLGFTLQNPLVLIIDGVNQLSGVAANLGWLPKTWPKNIRFIISATTEETRAELTGRGWGELLVHPLEVEERKQIAQKFLSEYGKALPAHEIERIASDPKCAHPLFLRTLLEELRIFGSHERLVDRIARYLATSNTDELFQVVLERMEGDFGEKNVRDIMSLLWAARTGLSEAELGDITNLGRLDISMLTISLDYHLLRREGLLSFFHDFLRRAVESRYLDSDDNKRVRHLALADYFEKIVMEMAEQELAEAAGAGAE